MCNTLALTSFIKTLERAPITYIVRMYLKKTIVQVLTSACMKFRAFWNIEPTGIWSPAEENNFSSSLCVQTSSEAHPASYPIGTGGSFPWGKAQPGREADHSLASSSEVNNVYKQYTPPPLAPTWR
jgi:hypothetical protein